MESEQEMKLRMRRQRKDRDHEAFVEEFNLRKGRLQLIEELLRRHISKLTHELTIWLEAEREVVSHGEKSRQSHIEGDGDREDEGPGYSYSEESRDEQTSRIPPHEWR